MHVLLQCACVPSEMPYGWEQVIDPVYGVYYIK